MTEMDEVVSLEIDWEDFERIQQTEDGIEIWLSGLPGQTLKIGSMVLERELGAEIIEDND